MEQMVPSKFPLLRLLFKRQHYRMFQSSEAPSGRWARLYHLMLASPAHPRVYAVALNLYTVSHARAF